MRKPRHVVLTASVVGSGRHRDRDRQEISPLEEADTEVIFAHPLHPYTQALLASIPVPVPRRRRERVRLEGDAPTPISPPPGCRFHTRCPIATPECKGDKPPLLEVRPGHRVACIHTDVSGGGIV